MRVVIDEDRCTGHGRCYSLAPQVFDADDDGFGVAVDLGPTPAADHRDQAQVAAASCPEGAITVID